MPSPSRALSAVALVLPLLAGCQHFPEYGGEPPEPGCMTTAAVTESVYLIGDAGDPELPPENSDALVDPVLVDLAADVGASVAQFGADQTAVIYLGDNVYPKGLYPEGHREREHGLRVLEAQVAAIGLAKGYFTAGNHDWDREGPSGWDHIVEQREFFEKTAPRITMQPPGGCAGPTSVDIGQYLRIVFVDPIGWIHAVNVPEQHRPFCAHQTAVDTYFALGAEFDHPEGRHLVLATHHPLLTAGPHGGHYTWKQHIFPLTDFWPNAWVPLPVIGSAYPLSRQLGVTGTDQSSQFYRRYMRAIERTMRPTVPLLVAAGHEHSLQVHRDVGGAFYVVSGAGSKSKVDRIQDMPTLLMGLAAPGYMRLDVHADGAVLLTVIALDNDDERHPVHQYCLAEGPPKKRARTP